MPAMPPARSATAAMLLSAAAGCGVGAELPAALSQLAPGMTYNDAPVAATIYGYPFRPAYQFDTTSGSATLEVGGFSAALVCGKPPPPGSPASFSLGAVTWESANILGAELPAGIPAGQYDLIVADPRGHSVRLPGAFTSLGADTIPPSVSISSPSDGGVIGSGATVDVIVAADDGYGQLASLEVTVGTGSTTLPLHICQVSGSTQTSCAFSIVAPAPAAAGDMLFVDAQAIGSGGLIGETNVSAPLVPAPVPTGISPAAGSTLGGTAVTLSGTGFVAGTTEVALDGQSATLSQVTPTSITALTPAHAAGPATVTVTTGGATATLTGTFSYLAPPVVRELSPTSGPASGLGPITIVGENFARQTTVIMFDGAPLLCPTYVNSNRIEGYIPPGAGIEEVTATDAVAGSSPGVVVQFDYLAGADAGAIDAGASATLGIDAGCPRSSGS
jgi:IPT/TIG domain/Bacterial Ig domain